MFVARRRLGALLRTQLATPLTIPTRTFSENTETPRAVSEVDVVIVGGGPAGLSAAIRLKQLDAALSVVVLEKASQVGGHVLSGAVVEPRALNELLPDWRSHEDKCSMTAVTDESMRFLAERRSFPLPVPPAMHNHGNYIVSLSELVRWLGRRAEELGVDVYPGFGGRTLVFDDAKTRVIGVATNDVGIDRHGHPKSNFERGLELRGRAILLAEGCHGSLSKTAISHFDLRAGRMHQTYGIGLKEVWEVRPEAHRAGHVTHSVGWPLRHDTYGGAFMYHFGDNLVSLGLVIGLDYTNPYLNPYREFQRMKLHPLYSRVLQGGKCIAYGARALNEGGWQSIPRLAFPGGALIGCAAGFLNVPKIKGTHTAMKSGMLAAETLVSNAFDLSRYEATLRDSWVGRELREVRNIRPAFHQPGGLYTGLLYSGLDCFVLKGRVPWTLRHRATPDHATLVPAAMATPIVYPKADGVLTFELLESVSRTGTNHEEDQPSHLQLKRDASKADCPQTARNYPLYGGPEQRFCPAGVYEYLEEGNADTAPDKPSADSFSDTATGAPVAKTRFQINAQNCIHCKTCDIKDPSQNINWVVPEGGGGPQYTCT